MFSSRFRPVVIIFSLTVVGLGMAMPVQAQVLAPDALLAGVSQREWAARWCQWVLPLPAGGVFGQTNPDPTLVGGNPIIETTGISGYKGAFSGSPDVFFLAGVASNSGVADRQVTVRPNQSLFFPMINAYTDNTNFFGQAPTNFTVDQMLTGAFGVDYISTFNGAGTLFLTIDGVSVTGLNAHRQTYGGDGFLVTYTGPDNSWNYFGVDASLNTGVYPSSVQTGTDGYWATVNPLSVGEHILTFGGTFDLLDPNGQVVGTQSQNITYHLTVTAAPEPGSALLLLPFLVASGAGVARKTKSLR